MYKKVLFTAQYFLEFGSSSLRFLFLIKLFFVFQPVVHQPLMTRRELMNPFDSEEEDEDPYDDLIIARSSPKEFSGAKIEVTSTFKVDTGTKSSGQFTH